MANISDIIRNAKLLGISITNAELGTDLCSAWADRVALAANLFERGDMVACQRMIDAANAYAI